MSDDIIDKEKEREKDKNDNMEIQCYAARTNAWFNTKLERDKSLLVLSAGAIGLLVTLLTTLGVESFALLYVFVASIFSFIVCLVSVLVIFQQNARFLQSLIAGKTTGDPLLGIFDYIAITSFIFGIILASIIGLSVATDGIITKETNMSEKKESTHKSMPHGDSLNGAGNVVPKRSDDLTRSFNGAQDIDPKVHNNGTSDSSVNSSSDNSSASEANSSGNSSSDNSSATQAQEGNSGSGENNP